MGRRRIALGENPWDPAPDDEIGILVEKHLGEMIESRLADL